jgi:hypothetical protein
MRSLEKQRPELIWKLGARRDSMRDAILDWEVPETAWLAITQGIELPDPNDVHVLAAAIAAFKRMRARRKKPQSSPEDFAFALEIGGLPTTAERLGRKLGSDPNCFWSWPSSPRPCNS